MTSRTYASLDRNRKGPGLALDESGLIVTTTVACDLERTILGDLHAVSGEYSYECYNWSTSRGDLSQLVAFGIAQPGSALTQSIGSEAKSYGLRVADGEIWNDGASIASIDPQAERVAMGLKLSLSPTLCTATWCVRGSAVHTETLANGKIWLPAFSLGGETAGDISQVVNFGERARCDFPLTPFGWSVQTSGLAVIRVSLATEGFMSLAGDEPSNQPYGPWLLNAKEIRVTRAPQCRLHRDGGGRANPAAFTVMRLDNSKGAFNALLRADVKNSTLVMQVLKAPAGGVGSLAEAVTVFTAIIESVDAPDAFTVEVTLRDKLSLWDKDMPARFIPPFYDEASAGKMLPMQWGASRNIDPPLLDAEADDGTAVLYALGDTPFSNLASVTDQAAPLDPNATPAQYVSALDGAGFKLDAPALGRVAVDCSTVGAQAAAPGIDDILAGVGDFGTWTAGVPDGWSVPTAPPFPASVVANGHIAQTSSYGRPSSLQIVSRVPYNPGIGLFGYPGVVWDAVLVPGETYVFRFQLLNATGNSLNAPYGLSILSALIDQEKYSITPFRQPLTSVFGDDHYHVIEYTVPQNPIGTLPIYFCACAEVTRDPTHTAPSTAQAMVVIDDLTIELKGAFEVLPLEAITLGAAVHDIIVNREALAAESFSSDDLADIDAVNGAILGLRKEDVPNTLDTIVELLDPYCAVPFTDEFGDARFRCLTDPEELAEQTVNAFAQPVVAAFSRANIDMSTFRSWVDPMPGLTTLFGCRPNVRPFADGDFVTDTVTVPPGLRAQYKGTSQFLFSASVKLAQQYQAAKSRDRYHLPIDVLEAAIATINRWMKLASVSRSFTIFEASYSNLTLGIGPTVQPQQLYYNDVITVDVPELGYNTRRMAVVETGPLYGAEKILIAGWHATKEPT